MDSEKYIGLDVHQATIVVAVTDSTGRLIMESILETEAATILQFFAGLRGTLSVTFEEETWSAWLYDLLNPHVDQECKKSLPGRSNTRISGCSRLLLRCLSNRSRDRIRKRSPRHPIRHRCKIHYSIFCHFPPHRCRERGHKCFAQVLS